MSGPLPGPAEDWVKIWRASGRELTGTEQLVEFLVESQDPAAQRQAQLHDRRSTTLALGAIAVGLVLVVLLWILVWKTSGLG